MLHKSIVEDLQKLKDAGVRFCIGASYSLRNKAIEFGDVDLSIHPDDYELAQSILNGDANFYGGKNIKKITKRYVSLDCYFGNVIEGFEFGKVATEKDEHGFDVWTEADGIRYLHAQASRGNMKAKMRLEKIENDR